MVKAVIFDLDGLLVDTEMISFEIYKRLLEKYDISFSLTDYVQNYSGKTEENNVARLIEVFNLPWSLSEGLEMVFALEKQLLQKDVGLKKGAMNLLNELKKKDVQIALATSSIKERAFQILSKHNLIDYFDVFVFGPECQHGKPYPDIFQIACEKLGAHPEECLVLEDSENGIQAAFSANIPVICIPDMKKPDKKHLKMTVAILNSLDEVIGYLY